MEAESRWCFKVYWIYQEDTEALTYEDFEDNRLVRQAVERNLEIIGEAINQIQKLDNELLNLVNTDKKYWENIKGVRNRLIHEYWGTSMEMIYEISVDEMDELLLYIEKVKEIQNNREWIEINCRKIP